MFSVLMSCYKSELILIFFLMLCDGACRLASSVIIERLIRSIYKQDKSEAYMFAGIEFILLMLAAVTRNHAFT